MKNLEIEQLLKEIISTEERCSDTIKELPSYKSLINDLSNNYSNDELEALKYLFQELERSIRNDIYPKKVVKSFNIFIENTKFDRKNHIEIKVYCHNLLKLSNRDEWVGRNITSEASFTMPFYKNKYETIKPIYEKIDEICSKFEIANKEEAEEKIAEYTGIKRKLI